MVLQRFLALAGMIGVLALLYFISKRHVEMIRQTRKKVRVLTISLDD